MTDKSKPQHGGPRTPSPGKKLGPPYRDRKLRVVKIQCTEEEWQRILAKIPDTRKRAEILLKYAVSPLFL